MIEQLSSSIQARATGRAIGAAALVYAICAALMGLGGAVIERYSGGIPVLDLERFFTEEKAHAMLGAYGEEGRRIYLYMEVVDLIYPLTYAALFSLLIAYTFKRIVPPGSRWTWLCALPCAMVLVDYAENAGIMTMCATYPERWPRLGAAAGAFNASKWTLGALTITAIAAGVLGCLLKKITARRARAL